MLSPFAAVARDPALTYEARHGQGVSTFSTQRGTLAVELTQLVDPADPVKLSRLILRNSGSAPLNLRVYAYAEWVLGSSRARSAPYVVPAYDAATGALTARNPYSLDFGDRVAFLASDRPPDAYTADRHEFIGLRGSVELPDSVAAGAALSKRTEAGSDPCSAFMRDVVVPPGGEAQLLVLMGDAGSADEAAALVERHRGRDFDERLAEVEAQWRGFLDTLQVETPDPAFDAMVNNWLPYQSLACRIRARSAFYQASGAFGFRDQLQDTLALLMHDPQLAHAQILNAARRQFREGDVQHWWLPRTDAGVRTMISDDVVWLGYALSYYVKVTGDASILGETVPFIEGPPLAPGEHDAFYTPEVSKETATLYEHASRALDLAIKRTGPNGLPLMLGGDWNDGMNRVGAEGRGESTWLAWFLLKTLEDMAPIAETQGDTAHAKAWRDHAALLKKAIEATAWDGEWYRRGTYDDGTPLGSRIVRRVPDRLHRPVLERAVRPRRPGALRHRHERRRGAPGRPGAEDRQALHPALLEDGEGARLHQELSARRPREWRPVHPCGHLVRHRAGRDGPRRGSLALLRDAQPGQPCARRGGGGALPRRTLCRGGRHLFGRRQGRPRRLDVVHRLGGLALPGRGRGHPRNPPRRRPAGDRAAASPALGRLFRNSKSRRRLLQNTHQESRACKNSCYRGQRKENKRFFN